MKLDNVYQGACVVLCNYLDGAVADYEEGMVDNVKLILSVIAGLKKLGGPTWDDYYNRVLKAAMKMKEDK